jgi:protein phosphatase
VRAGIEDDGIVTASLSHVGRVRSENQDACGEFQSAAGERLLVVADGMGGHRGGALASRICVETVARAFAEEEGAPEVRIRAGFERANQEVHSAALRDPELKGMGTTCVAFLITRAGQAWVAWVGDSRAYRFRHGQMEALSEDHSVVEEWVRLGVITPEEAEVHPQRHELRRAIGVEKTVQVDVRPIDVQPGDRFLLCSDGLSGYLSEAEIAAVLGFEPPEAAVQGLVGKVVEERDAPDNVTVQILSIPERFGASEASAVPPEGVSREAPPPEPRSWRISVMAAGLIVVGLALGGALYYALRVGGGGLPLARERGPEPPPASELTEADKRAEERRRIVAKRKQASEERQRVAQALRLQRAQERKARQAELESLLQRQLAGGAQAELPEVGLGSGELPKAAPGGQASPAPAGQAGVPLAAADPRAVPIERKLPPDQLEVAIREFLASWAEALNTDNYDLYTRLGMSQSKEQFHQAYAERAGAPVSLQFLGYKRWVGRFLSVRLRRTWPGGEPQEQKVVLRETESGLRYAGAR